MTRTLSALFSLYQLTPGRRIYALSRLHSAAKDAQLGAIVEAAEAAIAHDRHALELDAARLGTSEPVDLRSKDLAVDRRLAMIHELLEFYAAEEPEAASLREDCFPTGLAAHTHQNLVDQAAANERVLELLEAEERAEWIDAHGLRPLVEQLRTTHEAFAEALHLRDSSARPSWDEVKAARAEGQERYLEIVAMIIAQTSTQPELRAALMEPVLDQDARVQAYRAKRRKPAEVDPDTGVPLDADEAHDEPAALAAE